MDLSYFSEQRDHAIITLILDTGMRLGECLILKTEDMDMKNRVILLREDNTKGRKGCLITDEVGKTTREGVYAGGDAVTGAATVILAMGAGKTAATAIDEYIKSKN